MKIFNGPDEDRVAQLRAWIQLLRSEAQAIPNGVLTVWHPEAMIDLLEEAFPGTIVEIDAETVTAALGSWRQRFSCAHSIGGVRSLLT